MKSNLLKSGIYLIMFLLLSPSFLIGSDMSYTQNNMTLKASLIGGVCQTMTSNGDTLFLGVGSEVLAMKVNRDSTITTIAKTTVSGQVCDIVYKPGLVVAKTQRSTSTGYYHSLSIIDFSSGFEVQSIIDFDDRIEDYDIYSNRIFLFLGKENKVDIYNIDNLASPYLEKVYDYDYIFEHQWPIGQTRFTISDSLMFYVSDGLSVMRITDSLNIEKIAECDGFGDIPESILLDGTNLYVGGWIGCSIYNIADINNITLAATTNSCDIINNMSVSDSMLYLQGETNLFIYNINNPDSPVLIKEFEPNMPMSGVYVKDNWMYISFVYKGMKIFEAGTDSLKNDIVSYSPFGFIQNMDINDNTLYTVSGTHEMSIINIGNISNPTIEGSFIIPDYLSDIAVFEDVAYVSAPEVIYLLNIADPDNISLIDTIGINEYQPILNVSGNYLYVCDGLWGIKIYDISKPLTPVLTGSYTSDLIDAVDIVIKDNYAYVSSAAYNRLHVLDISDPAAPILSYEIDANIGTYSKSSIWQNRLYVGMSDPLNMSNPNFQCKNIEIFDLSNPALPMSVGQIEVGEQVYSVTGVSGDYLFTVSSLTGLHVYKVDDLSNIEEVGFFNSSDGIYGKSSSMAVYNNNILIGNANGLYVIQNDSNSKPTMINGLTDTTIFQFSDFEFEYNALDVDGDRLNYQIENSTDQISISGYLGTLTLCPENIDKDTTFILIISITDSKVSVYDTAFVSILKGNSLNDNSTNIPDEFFLYQNYPNPFNPVTTIQYKLPKESKVVLSIYDMNGRLTETIVNETQTAGYYRVLWDASQYSSGVYLYKIQSGDFQQIRKGILIK